MIGYNSNNYIIQSLNIFRKINKAILHSFITYIHGFATTFLPLIQYKIKNYCLFCEFLIFILIILLFNLEIKAKECAVYGKQKANFIDLFIAAKIIHYDIFLLSLGFFFIRCVCINNFNVV